MMHGGAGQQRGNRNPVRARHAVGQDDDVDAFAHRGLGARTQFVEHLLKSGGAEPGMDGAGGKVVSRVGDLKWVSARSEIERIFSRSASVRIGWRTSRRLVPATPCRSNRLGRGPTIETKLTPSSSRVGTTGGV